MSKQRCRLQRCSWLLGLLCLAEVSQAATRVALVNACEVESSRNILALAEARLSQEQGLELVERDRIDRVMGEQLLAQCGIVDSARALTVGRLLNADLFAAIESSRSENAALGLVVFDAAT